MIESSSQSTTARREAGDPVERISRRAPIQEGTMTFELWDMRSRNAIGGFDSEAAALAAVRQLIEDYGRSYVDDLFLGREDDQGNSAPIAKGQQLTDLALSAAQRSRVEASR